MIKIIHRVNNLDELKKIDKSYGVEVDIHAYGEKLIVNHSSFEDGPKLSDWLLICGDRLVILNIKEEGIESRVRDMALEFGIKNFMLLDLSFPALVKMSNEGESRIAIRVSEYESVEKALLFESKIDWVWLDCFNGFPLTVEEFHRLKKSAFKICLVSPELHGPPRDKDDIQNFQNFMHSIGAKVDAVCTKNPEMW
tara:strand:+ start:1076 stop:1663 length:588 start_codon:yes stop_codon:yes gene_type:complete